LYEVNIQAKLIGWSEMKGSAHN